MRIAVRAAIVAAILAVSRIPVALAQEAPDRDAILAVVHRLFDGMRTGDSGTVRSVFHPRVMLATAAVRQGHSVIQIDELGEFVTSVGSPHDQMWDERLGNEEVRQDGTFAAVWAEYSFYLGDKFSHCGVDAFHLAKEGGEWKIVALSDTRRREGCPDLPGS